MIVSEQMQRAVDHQARQPAAAAHAIAARLLERALHRDRQITGDEASPPPRPHEVGKGDHVRGAIDPAPAAVECSQRRIVREQHTDLRGARALERHRGVDQRAQRCAESTRDPSVRERDLDAQCRVNLTGISTHTATGPSLPSAGLNFHSHTHANAASSSPCTDSFTYASWIAPSLPTRACTLTVPCQPSSRALSGYSGGTLRVASGSFSTQVVSSGAGNSPRAGIAGGVAIAATVESAASAARTRANTESARFLNHTVPSGRFTPNTRAHRASKSSNA